MPSSQPVPGPIPSSVATPIKPFNPSQRLLNELAKFYQPYVRTTKRPVHLYHYTSKSQFPNPTTAITAKDQRIYFYTNYLKESFWSGNGYGMMGPGLYVATDPFATMMGYGKHSAQDTDWVLLQLVLPQNSRVLSISQLSREMNSMSEGDPSNKPLPKLTDASKKELVDSTCFFDIASAPKHFLATGLLSLFGFPQCQNLKVKLMQKLDIWAIDYLYDSVIPEAYKLGLCLNPNEAPLALVLIDDRAIDTNRMVAFTDTVPVANDPQQENRLLIEDFRNLLNTTSDALKSNPIWPLWPTLVGQKPKYDTKTWINQTFFNCGDDTYYPNTTP